MERLASHSLHDDDASDMGRLMHSCTWTLEPLWKWMHHLAEHAKNPNIKREAGRTLGALYYEARQKKNRVKLGKANEEFEREVAPFGGIKKKPTDELVRWVSIQMRQHHQLWKRAIMVAERFEDMKHPEHRYSFARCIVENGINCYERLPMTTMAEAWDSFFIQERQGFPHSSSWSEFLDELSQHPFCTKRMTLAQLTNFDICWEMVLHSSLREEWKTDGKQKRVQVKKDASFVHLFGDLKHREGHGYRVAKDYFNRFFIPHWDQMRLNQTLLRELRATQKQGTGTAVDPVSKRVLAVAKRAKSSTG